MLLRHNSKGMTILYIFSNQETFRLIKDNDDPASKDFVIFVAKKKWAYSNLRPLLELCKNDDRLERFVSVRK